MGLLKGIHPLLTPDLLHVLRSMGHGDTLVICDCNFPAATLRKHTVVGTSTSSSSSSSSSSILLTCTAPEAIDAICSVLPLDYFQKDAQWKYMSPETDTMIIPEKARHVWKEVERVILTHSKDAIGCPLKRFEFYDDASKAFAIVQTMERRPYGNFILIKGCVGPDGLDLKPE